MQRDAIREEGRAFPSPSRSGKRKRREVWGDSARRSRARVTRRGAGVGVRSAGLRLVRDGGEARQMEIHTQR